MSSKPLSNIACQSAKHSPEGRGNKLFDGGGLFLELMPSGSKKWRLKFRFNGKENRMSFGDYPTVSLSDARERREAAKKLLANGTDPARQRDEVRRREADLSAAQFSVVADEWINARRGHWSEGHTDRIQKLLERDIYPDLGRSTHIAEALMAAVAPLEKPKSSPEARFAQLHKALRESHAAGYRHCLVIDEAHALPIPTIKHLKRFFELEMGFKKLLSIILIGQPELKAKLSERNQEVREVVQRCEMVELAPLNNSHLDEYLKFKFGRMNKPVDDVIDASGIDALRAKLTITANRRDRPEAVSLLYPLAIGNLLTACMNLAAEIGVPKVTADVVKGV
jgi:type II secretory pathway predicted ATPase ExeA